MSWKSFGSHGNLRVYPKQGQLLRGLWSPPWSRKTHSIRVWYILIHTFTNQNQSKCRYKIYKYNMGWFLMVHGLVAGLQRTRPFGLPFVGKGLGLGGEEGFQPWISRVQVRMAAGLELQDLIQLFSFQPTAGGWGWPYSWKPMVNIWLISP